MTHPFARAVGTYFVPFLAELGFAQAAPTSVSGKHYSAKFQRTDRAVVVSYEPGESSLLIAFPFAVECTLSEFDDRRKTPRLEDLTRHAYAVVSPVELEENKRYFAHCAADTPLEKMLLRAALDTRVCLRYGGNLLTKGGA